MESTFNRDSTPDTTTALLTAIAAWTDEALTHASNDGRLAVARALKAEGCDVGVSFAVREGVAALFVRTPDDRIVEIARCQLGLAPPCVVIEGEARRLDS